MDKNQFIADLITAIDDAERASKLTKSQLSIAKDTFQKLHFDFPLVTPTEISALSSIFTSSSPLPDWARITDKFLDIVQENATDNSIQQDKDKETESDRSKQSQTLAIAYQQLYCNALLTTLSVAFTSTDDQVSDLLSGISLDAPSSYFNHNDDEIDEISLQEEEKKEHGMKSLQHEKLLYLSTKLQYSQINAVFSTNLPQIKQCLIALRENKDFLLLLPIAGMLCTLLHDHCIAVPSDIDSSMQALLQGLHIIPNQASSSSINSSARTTFDEASKAALILVLGTASSLTYRFTHASSRRKLYLSIRDYILPVAAHILECYEVQRAKRVRLLHKASQDPLTSSTSTSSSASSNEEQEENSAIHSIAAITEFIVVEGKPPLAKPIHVLNLLQSSGILSGLTLAFIHRTPRDDATASHRIFREQLQRVLLVCCACFPELCAWMKAIPGFQKALDESFLLLNGDESMATASTNSDITTTSNNSNSNSNNRYTEASLYYYLFSAVEISSSSSLNNPTISPLTASPDELIAQCLLQPLSSSSISAALETTSSDTGTDMNDDKVIFQGIPVVYRYLRILSLVHQVKRSGGSRDLLWGEETDRALKDIAGVLRKDVVPVDGGAHKSDEVDDMKKLQMSAEDQAALLLNRKAQSVRPECLRMIKELTAQPGVSGKAD